MKVLTEIELRHALKNLEPDTWTIPEGTILTPAAEEFLKTRRIQPVFGQQSEVKAESKARTETAGFTAVRPGFTGPDGGHFEHKPEGMTHIHGRQLVYKSHPVIIFRGRLDSLCASIISAQQNSARGDFVNDLEDILEFVRSLLIAELKNETVPEFSLLGLDASALREQSHNPEKFFGCPHLKMTYKLGPLGVALNLLRTQVREVELAAAVAFEGQEERQDIILALNRLSSLFYILIFRYLPEGFKPESAGI